MKIELGDYIGLNSYQPSRVDQKKDGLIILETGQSFKLSEYADIVWSHYRWDDNIEDYSSIQLWDAERFVRSDR